MLNQAQANNILLRADIEKARFQWTQLASTYDALIKNDLDIALPVLAKYWEIKSLIDEAEKIVPNLFDMEITVNSSEWSVEAIYHLQEITNKNLLGNTGKSFACLEHYIETFKQGGHVVVEQECLNAIDFAVIIINMLNQLNSVHKASIPNEIKILVEQIRKIISQKEPMLGADPSRIYFNSFLFKTLNVKDINQMSMLENAYVQLEHFYQCCFHKDNVMQTTLNYLHCLPDRWQIITQLYSEMYDKDEELINNYSQIEYFINNNQLGNLADLSLKYFCNFTYEIKKLCEGFVYHNCINTLAGTQIQLNINSVSKLAELEAKIRLRNINDITTGVADLANIIAIESGSNVNLNTILESEKLNLTANFVSDTLISNRPTPIAIITDFDNIILEPNRAVCIASAFLKAQEGIAAVQAALLHNYPDLSEYGTHKLIKALLTERGTALEQELKDNVAAHNLHTNNEVEAEALALALRELQTPEVQRSFSTKVMERVDTNNDPFLSGFVDACKSNPALQDLAAQKVQEVLAAGVADKDELKEGVEAELADLVLHDNSQEMLTERASIVGTLFDNGIVTNYSNFVQQMPTQQSKKNIRQAVVKHYGF